MKDSEFRELFSCRWQEIYLDNAASTFKMRAMTEAMSDYDLQCGVNIARGSYRSARITEAAVELARKKIRSFLSAGQDTEVIFTHGATDGLNLLARSCTSRLRPGSNVVMTAAEHHSNLLPWLQSCRQRGAELRLAEPRVDTDGKGNRRVRFFAEDILSLVDADTALITLTCCSNVTGSIMPVQAVANAVSERKIPVLADGAQLVAHKKVNFLELGCDALCFSAHKLYGPTGLGVICAGKGFLESVEPDIYGGGTVEHLDLPTADIGWKTGAARWEAGTLPISQILGFSAVLDRLQDWGMENLAAWEEKLRAYLLQKIEDIPGIYAIHGGEGAAPVVSLGCAFMSSLDLAALCDANRIAVRAGKHCAHPFLAILDEPSVLRVSMAGYNTLQELDTFVQLLRQWQRRFG